MLKNLRISCPSCNRSKGAKSLNEFLKYRNQAELFITASAKWLNRNQKFIRVGTVIATASPYIEIAIYVAPPTYKHILKPFGKGFMKGYRLAARDKTYPEFYQAAAMLAGCQYHVLDIKDLNGASVNGADHPPGETPVTHSTVTTVNGTDEDADDGEGRDTTTSAIGLEGAVREFRPRMGYGRDATTVAIGLEGTQAERNRSDQVKA